MILTSLFEYQFYFQVQGVLPIRGFWGKWELANFKSANYKDYDYVLHLAQDVPYNYINAFLRCYLTIIYIVFGKSSQFMQFHLYKRRT